MAHRLRKALGWTLLLTALLVGTAHGERRQLLAEFRDVRYSSNENPFREPLFIRSSGSEDHLGADIYAILPQPFAQVRAALAGADQWCRFLVLNQNVKACTWRPGEEGARLSLFVGRKHYQTPGEAFQVEGDFRVRATRDDYLRVQLRADEGPLGTENYDISVQATPMGEDTLVQLSWGYEDSWRSRMATSTYLATLGRDKVGFTIVGQDTAGRPQYVQGVRGIIERNAMRYYLALRAYLENADVSESRRLEASMSTWYDWVERYARQLHELGREEYLANKRREWRNQRRLQRDVAAQAQASTGSSY